MRKETKYIMRVHAQEQFYIAIDEDLEELIEFLIVAIAMAWGSDAKLSILQDNMRTRELAIIFDTIGYRENMS